MAENDIASTAKQSHQADTPAEERHDREYWVERAGWFKGINGRRATRHVLAGALHDLVGNTSEKQVQARIDKFLKGEGK